MRSGLVSWGRIPEAGPERGAGLRGSAPHGCADCAIWRLRAPRGALARPGSHRGPRPRTSCGRARGPIRGRP